MDHLYENVRKALIEGKYDALMRKALGTNRLPKDHNYTSAVASNGDFVVHNANGKVVGRIKKGEHDAIKEEIGDITVKSKSSADAYAQHTGQDAKKTSVPKDPKTGKTLYQKVTSEEVEELDEVSTELATSFYNKGKGQPKRAKSVALAFEKIRARHANVPTTEEVEQVDEDKVRVGTLAQRSQAYRDDKKLETELQAQRQTKKSVEDAKKKYGMKEAKDSREYDYEGEMVLNQLEQMMHHIGELKNLVKPNTNLPEWVQSKITLSNDYIQTASDYLKGEMKEEVELDEATVKSNKDGESGGRGKTFSSGSPNSYKVVGSDGEHLATANNMKDPKYGGRTTHWHVTWHKKEHKDSPTSFQFMHQLKKYAKELDEQVQIDEISAELAAKAGDAADNKLRAMRNQRKFGSNPSPAETKLSNQVRKFDDYSDKKQGYTNEEVELEEGRRGRPKKQLDHVVNPNNKEKLYFDNPEHAAKIEKLRKNKVLPPVKKEPSEHIINRLGQAATNMTGGQHITYDNGKTHRVTNSLASRTLAHYRGLKPAEKEDFQKKIAKSHEDHINALSGK